MGFHEDDRIRSKNRAYNSDHALTQYYSLRHQGYTDYDIAQICVAELKSHDKIRNDIFSTVLEIVGRSKDEGPIS
jgi:hypothetical protein